MFPTSVVQTFDANQASQFNTNSFNMIMPMQPQPAANVSTLVSTQPITSTAETTTAGGDETVSEAASLQAKLALSERTCEIYRHQIRYMQDQMQNLRVVIQDKENVIDNLILRYDLGDIPAVEQTEDEQMEQYEINVEELRKKSEALAQRTMLENFELREMLTDLRDENFQLRHEVFELSDRLNRSRLQLANLTQKAQIAAKGSVDGSEMDQGQQSASQPKKGLPPKGGAAHYRDESNPIPDLHFDENLESDEEDPIDDPKAVAKRQERERRESLKQQPDLFGPAMTQEAIEKRAMRAEKAHRRGSSAAMPSGLLPLDDDDDESGMKRRGSVENIDHANTEEARQIRAQRAAKHHKRDSSAPIPNLFNAENSDEEDGTKRRDSLVDPANTAEAIRIRQERQAKHHKRDSSAPIPDLFGADGDQFVGEEYGVGRRDSYMDPANTAEAQRIRQERAAKHHKRESSIPTPDIFAENADERIDIQSERARKANAKRDSIATPNIFKGEDDPEEASMTAKAIAIREARQQKRDQHRRDSSVAVPDMFAPNYEERLEKQQQRANKKRDSTATPNIFDEHPSQTAEAIEIRDARAAKHHKRVSSIPTPNIFADDADQRLEIQAKRAAKRRESLSTPNIFADNAEDAIQKRAERAARDNKKRDSITAPVDMFNDPRSTPEAIAKRKERERKANQKRDSLITPSIFQNDPSMTPEAIRKRLARQAKAHHRKLSSQAAPDLFGNALDSDDDEAAMKHARRQSREVLMRKAGDAGHFSDPETESNNKKQRIEYDIKRKKRKARKKREQSKAQALEDSHHRRESTIPIPNLHFDSDSDDEKFNRNEDKLKISALEIELERFVEKCNRLQHQLDQKSGGAVTGSLNPLGATDDYDPNEDLIMGATTTTGGGPEYEMVEQLQLDLTHAVDSKMILLQSTSKEIGRLNHIIAVLLHVFNVKWNVVQKLVDDYENKSNA